MKTALITFLTFTFLMGLIIISIDAQERPDFQTQIDQLSKHTDLLASVVKQQQYEIDVLTESLKK